MPGRACRIVVVTVALLLAIATATAADGAALSVDGNTLYTLADSGLKVTPLPGSPALAAARVINLHRWFRDQRPRGLQVANDGSLILLGTKALYRLEPDFTKPILLAPAPSKVDLVDVAYDPATGNILVTGSGGEDGGRGLFWILPSKTRRLQRVTTRSVDDVDCPAFNAKGELFFASQGDLWSGSVEWDGDGHEGRWVVTATRVAPVAYRYTYTGTPQSRGVVAIVPMPDQIFLDWHRLNGSDLGEIWKLEVR